jgi:hypothetical protein
VSAEIIFLKNILGRGGDVKKARKRATNVKSFLSNHSKKEGKQWRQ